VSNVVMLRAVLLDVGGTLWPDRPTAHVSPDPCLEQLGRLLPEVDAAQALTTLRGELRQDDGALVQDTHGLLARALRALRANSAELDVIAVRRALCARRWVGTDVSPARRPTGTRTPR
jgi:hypothetical protein